MKFVADVNITQKVIRYLRSAGHEVIDIKDLDLKMSDVEIIQLARDQKSIILSHDKDFLYPFFKEMSFAPEPVNKVTRHSGNPVPDGAGASRIIRQSRTGQARMTQVQRNCETCEEDVLPHG